jgi:hypothetical protein
VPRAHGYPAQLHHQQLKALGALGCSFEWWKINLFENRVRGYALHAIVTYLTTDVSQESSPRVWWCYGTGSAKALTKELWFNPAMYTRFKVMIA